MAKQQKTRRQALAQPLFLVLAAIALLTWGYGWLGPVPSPQFDMDALEGGVSVARPIVEIASRAVGAVPAPDGDRRRRRDEPFDHRGERYQLTTTIEKRGRRPISRRAWPGEAKRKPSPSRALGFSLAVFIIAAAGTVVVVVSIA